MFESHLTSSFIVGKEMFRFVVLPCFDLRRSKSSHAYMGIYASVS